MRQKSTNRLKFDRDHNAVRSLITNAIKHYSLPRPWNYSEAGYIEIQCRTFYSRNFVSAANKNGAEIVLLKNTVFCFATDYNRWNSDTRYISYLNKQNNFENDVEMELDQYPNRKTKLP